MWHFVKDGETQGPVTPQQLLAMARSGMIDKNTLVQTEGQLSWMPLWKTEFGADLLANLPPSRVPKGKLTIPAIIAGVAAAALIASAVFQSISRKHVAMESTGPASTAQQAVAPGLSPTPIPSQSVDLSGPRIRIVGVIRQHIPREGLVIYSRDIPPVTTSIGRLGGGGNVYVEDSGDIHGTFLLRGHPHEESLADGASIKVLAVSDGVYHGRAVIHAYHWVPMEAGKEANEIPPSSRPASSTTSLVPKAHSQPTPHPASEARAEATRRYPALGQDGSPFNLQFLVLFYAAKELEPETLARSDWPLALATRAAATLRVHAVSKYPALDEKNGFRNFRLGAPITQFAAVNMRQLRSSTGQRGVDIFRENGSQSFLVADAGMTVGNAKLHSIELTVCENILAQVILSVNDKESIVILREALIAAYGEPTETHGHLVWRGEKTRLDFFPDSPAYAVFTSNEVTAGIKQIKEANLNKLKAGGAAAAKGL